MNLNSHSKMGVGGKAIPPYTDRVTEITSDAKFILLVEKDAAFMRLAEDRFYNTYPCVIITAKVSEGGLVRYGSPTILLHS
jgi:meiotic recombination protein SPO11